MNNFKTKMNNFKTKMNNFKTKMNNFKTKMNNFKTKMNNFKTKMIFFSVQSPQYQIALTALNFFFFPIIKNSKGFETTCFAFLHSRKFTLQTKLEKFLSN